MIMDNFALLSSIDPKLYMQLLKYWYLYVCMYNLVRTMCM